MPRAVRPWFRFYVEAFGDRKLLRLTPTQRWVWVAVLGAARESPTPGRLLIAEGVPLTVSELARYADVKDREAQSALDTMVTLGMVTVEDSVVTVTNWGRRQFESDDVTARTRDHRERSEEQGRNVPKNDVGTHQRQRQRTELSSDPDERADVEALCTRLADRIEANGSKRPTVSQAWRDEARRMIDIDKRDPEKAARLIDWCQADPFWRANVLSMPTFRKQYDQLRLKATAEWEARKGGLSPDGEVDPEIVLGPDSWTIPDPPEGVEPGTPDYTSWARRVRDDHRAERVAQAREHLERRAG